MLFIYAALGGVLGTLLRYGLGGWIFQRAGTEFPWGTLAVNAIGCFVLGATMQFAQSRGLAPNVRVFITVGFCGALTTFSSYIFETQLLAQRDGMLRAASYGFGSVAVGFAALLAGAALAARLLQ